jgi:hypothetical protein
MTRENAEQNYLRFLETIAHLIDSGQISPELLQELQEYRIPEDGNGSDNNPARISDIIRNLLLHRDNASNGAIDRQSLAVQLKHIGCEKATIKDEKIKHTESGGLHSEVEQAIIISCEGKRIEAPQAQGICEVTGKLAQKTLSCRRCHRSICLRHCEFIEQDGANYPYCNTPIPGSRITCYKKTILSLNTWHETEKRMKQGRRQ